MKYCYKLPPCPSYDLEGMECWLTDLALEGLMLAEDGFFFGVGCFLRTQPRKVRYRLTAAEVTPSLLNDYDTPSEEAIGISEAMGWQFVCRRGSFYIYRTELPSAPELHSDPEIMALTLNKLKRYQRNDLIGSAVTLALTLLLGFALGRVHFWITWINLGTPLFLLTLLWLITGFCSRVLGVVRVGRLRSKLLSAAGLEQAKNYKTETPGYYTRKLLMALLVLLWCLFFCLAVGRHLTDADKIPLSDYDAPLPFATAQAFVPGDYAETSMFESNSVRVWSDPLASCNYDYHEQATVSMDDGRQWEVNYYVEYHQALSPWLARQIAEEYTRYQRSESQTVLDLPELDVDYALAFTDHGTRVVLQKGCAVIHVHFSQYREYQLPLAEWVAILAESIG